jgi:phage N-6-adenine-methyltransferase
MSKLTTFRRPELAVFDPAMAAERDAQADAVIDYARRVKDWPLLEEAVDVKIADQRAFVEWWDAQLELRADRGATMPRLEEDSGIMHQQVSRWRHWLADEPTYRERLLGAGYKAAALMEAEGTNVRGTQGTGDNEWFTPAEYIELARKVLGVIDLDPASHPLAQKIVQARTFFTKKQDGLSKEWGGRVWLNPPYAQPEIGNFIDKLIAEFVARRVSAAVLLTHNYTDTSWFHNAASVAERICFTRGRIRFEAPHGEIAAPTQGQAFFYFGDDRQLFSSTFAETGFVVAPI